MKAHDLWCNQEKLTAFVSKYDWWLTTQDNCSRLVYEFPQLPVLLGSSWGLFPAHLCQGRLAGEGVGGGGGSSVSWGRNQLLVLSFVKTELGLFVTGDPVLSTCYNKLKAAGGLGSLRCGTEVEKYPQNVCQVTLLCNKLMWLHLVVKRSFVFRTLFQEAYS